MFVLQGEVYFLVVRYESDWSDGHLDMYEKNASIEEVKLKSTIMGSMPKSNDNPYSFYVTSFIGPDVNNFTNKCNIQTLYLFEFLLQLLYLQ